jgi:release factor glutamine methyltransferase
VVRERIDRGRVTTVSSLLDAATVRIRDSGSGSPRLDAELILGHVLGIDRVGIIAHPEAPVGDSAADRFEASVERRVAGEPVAYILGVREFYGLAFVVDERALVPRPETEILVDAALDRITRRLTGAPRPPGTLPLRVVDVGTGSGAIAVSLAVTLRRRGMAAEASIAASDISDDALAVAVENAVGHGVADRIDLFAADLLSPLVETAWDVVIANLPYVTSAALDQAGPMLAHEPRIALDGGADGLAVIGRLVAQLPVALAPGGIALLEIGEDQARGVVALVEGDLPGARCEVVPDLTGRARAVVIERAER